MNHIFKKGKKAIVAVLTLLFMCCGLVGSDVAFASTKIFYEGANAPQVTVINYHHFGYKGEYPLLENIRVEPEAFRAQLQKLKDEGYETITQTQLINYLKGIGRIPKKSLLITIDDGFESVYQYAYPILKEMGMTAVFFPIISNVEEGERFGAPMVSWEQLKEIAQSKVMEIGNHTYDLHWRGNNNTAGYEAMTWGYDKNGNKMTNAERKEWIKNDLLKAERIYKENTGLDMAKAISYPYGAYDNITLEVAKELGYKIGYTVKSTFNTFGSGSDNLLEVNRITMDYRKDANYIVNTLQQFNTQANAIYATRNSRISTKYTLGDNKLTVTVRANKGYNTVQNIRFELWKMQNGVRTYVGQPSVTVAKLSKTQQSFTFTDNFEKVSAYQIYGRGTLYSMKVIMTNTDGSKNIEWINYTYK